MIILEKLTKPVVILCIAGAALLVALVVLYVVTRDLYPRLGVCEAKVQPCAEPCPASPPTVAEPGMDGGQEELTANGDAASVGPPPPPSPPAQQSGVAPPSSTKKRRAPCARRRGGMAMPGALTRRARVQISEFTPAMVMASTGDDAPPGPEKVVVRRITGAPPSVIEGDGSDDMDDDNMEDDQEEQ